jgi:hypothetical protein
MKRRMILIIVVALAVFSGVNMNTPTLAEDGFYVVAGGGGPKGKVLNTQMLNWYDYDNTLGNSGWSKVTSSSVSYTKISATSKLVITYQDFLTATVLGTGSSQYKIVANDTSADFANSPMIVCSTSTPNSYLAQGIWSNLPKGVVNFDIYHRQFNVTACTRSYYGGGANIVVMEIEP